MLTINPLVRIDTDVKQIEINGKPMASSWYQMIYFNHGLFDFHRWRKLDQPETHI